MIKYEELLVNTKVYKALESDLLEDRLNHCYMIMSEDALAVDGLCTLFARKYLQRRTVAEIVSPVRKSKTAITNAYTSRKTSKPTV